MKNIRIFIQKISVFGGEIFNVYELACFLNVFFFSSKHISWVLFGEALLMNTRAYVFVEKNKDTASEY